MKNFIPILILVLALSAGCTSMVQVPYDIYSDPEGAEIEIDGAHMGYAPMVINFSISREWVGLLYSDDGWSYGDDVFEITAYPPAGSIENAPQTKYIKPAYTIEGGEMHFQFQPRLVLSASVSSAPKLPFKYNVVK
jgi:hypothetical protein